MRQLLYVPIIHEEADLGSAGKALAGQSLSLVGRRRWAYHREVVGGFWESVGAYLCSLDPCRLKLYQDGLPADGALGRRIVEDAANKGSRNYQLLRELVARGAELRKTEDPWLLVQERENLLAMLRQPRFGQGTGGSQQYANQRDRLMARRDRRVAEAINDSLKEGELGALLMGAYHNVLAHLAADIQVRMLKVREKVRAYLEELFLGQDERSLEELGEYLVSPVEPV